MTAHRLVAVEGDAGHVAACACGWRSEPACRDEVAEARWRGHVRAAHLAALLDRAERGQAAAVHNVENAVVLAFRSRAARNRLHRLAVPVSSVGPAGDPEQSGDGSELETGRMLAGLSVVDLWARYVRLGGDASERDFGRWLRGEQGIASFDHDVIALALNEHFADVGFGQPVEYWR